MALNSNERRERVHPVKITKLCLECGADMKGAGYSYPTDPPRYVHLCSANGDHPAQTFTERYPTVVFEELPGDDHRVLLTSANSPASSAGTVPAGGLMVEEKVDGWRAVYLPDHTGRRRLFTRNGHPIEGVGHILWRLEQMERAAGVPMVFDGEFQVGGSLEATKAWCEREWRHGGEAGQFFAFDALPYAQWQSGGTDQPLVERKARLAHLFAATEALSWEWRPRSHGRDEQLPPVVLVEDGWVFDAGDAMKEARRVWSRNGEGVVLKAADAPYRRLRTDAWQKLKRDTKWLRRAA
jgi:ATP-dependent DNA ligase